MRITAEQIQDNWSELHKIIDDNFEGERLAIVGDVTLVYNPDILDYSQGYIHPRYWKVY